MICAALWPDPADGLCPESFRKVARSLMELWARNHRGLLSQEIYPHFVRNVQRRPQAQGDGRNDAAGLCNPAASLREEPIPLRTRPAGFYGSAMLRGVAGKSSTGNGFHSLGRCAGAIVINICPSATQGDQIDFISVALISGGNQLSNRSSDAIKTSRSKNAP